MQEREIERGSAKEREVKSKSAWKVKSAVAELRESAGVDKAVRAVSVG